MIREVGTLVQVQTIVRDLSGAVTNAPTVTITVTAPDGTPSTPTVTNTNANGVYTATITLTQAGLWRWTWSSSGAVVAVQSDQLTAVSTQRALVASLDEFAAQLNRTDSTDNNELRTYLAAATDWVERTIGGPIVPTTITETGQVRNGSYALRRRPVISVTSITPSLGDPLSAGSYILDADTGVVRQIGNGWYTFVYRAGLSVMPERVKLAGLMLAEHLWQVQNGGGGLPFPGDADLTPQVPMGFAVPRRVEELLAVDREPGFA